MVSPLPTHQSEGGSRLEEYALKMSEESRAGLAQETATVHKQLSELDMIIDMLQEKLGLALAPDHPRPAGDVVYARGDDSPQMSAVRHEMQVIANRLRSTNDRLSHLLHRIDL